MYPRAHNRTNDRNAATRVSEAVAEALAKRLETDDPEWEYCVERAGQFAIVAVYDKTVLLGYL
jgi:hypothetical protein